MRIRRWKRRFTIHNAKFVMVMTGIAATIGLIASGFTTNETAAIHNDLESANLIEANKPDSAASAAAFLKVYKVLMSPRCMNCHPAGDIPLQGADSHLHTMSPKRGKDGHGLYAMKCANCHQPTNAAGLHTPPGNPKWALPPSEMKMVFQGKTARQLAMQIRDYNQNGHKNKQQLLEHARDTLVKAGWTMGEGRPAPPLTHAAFVKAWDTWIEKGMYAPPVQR